VRIARPGRRCLRFGLACRQWQGRRGFIGLATFEHRLSEFATAPPYHACAHRNRPTARGAKPPVSPRYAARHRLDRRPAGFPSRSGVLSAFAPQTPQRATSLISWAFNLAVSCGPNGPLRNKIAPKWSSARILREPYNSPLLGLRNRYARVENDLEVPALPAMMVEETGDPTLLGQSNRAAERQLLAVSGRSAVRKPLAEADVRGPMSIGPQVTRSDNVLM
jgi:hypothetical protein